MVFQNLQFNNLTLDVDSTIHTRYGTQQGAKKGYNPKKPGRLSHHPLMAFVAECKMVANFWLRSGDSYTSNNIEAFLDDTFEKLQGKKMGLLRADSGFYDKKVFTYLEDKRINYIVAVRLYAPVQQLIASHKTWLRLSDGIEVAESIYQSPLWDKSRRVVMVRQHVPTRAKATGRSLKLFQEEGICKQYRYSCFITSLDLPCEQIWTLYRQRADAENRIKELKYDFGSDSFNQHSFCATEAALNFVMMAYNFISLFRQVVLRQKVHQQMKTLRYHVFAIGHSDRTKQFNALLSRDRYMRPIAPMVYAPVEKWKVNARELLSLDYYKEVTAEYDGMNNKNRNPNWYSLFGGPSTVEALASHLKFFGLCELYRSLSNSVHGTDITQGKLSDLGGERVGILQLRYPKDAHMITGFADNVCLVAFTSYVKIRLPEMKSELDKWVAMTEPFREEMARREFINFKEVITK